MKAPNSKLQAPEKHQAPTIKQTASLLFGASMFGISLELGAWDLELPPGSPFSARLITRKRFAICAGSEHQAPSSREAPKIKKGTRLWSFAVWNFSGAWSLGFGASAAVRACGLRRRFREQRGRALQFRLGHYFVGLRHAHHFFDGC